MAISNPPTEEQVLEARAHLRIALGQSLPSDDSLIIGHVKYALILLGGHLPEITTSTHESRRSA